MQGILDIKEKLETQAKVEFTLAQNRLDEENEKLTTLQTRKENYLQEGRKLRKNELHVKDLRENRDAILRMDDFIKNQMKVVAAAEKEVDRARAKLNQVMQERKTHDRLKEKALEAYKAEENKEDAAIINELTSYTYGKKGRV